MDAEQNHGLESDTGDFIFGIGPDESFFEEDSPDSDLSSSASEIELEQNSTEGSADWSGQSSWEENTTSLSDWSDDDYQYHQNFDDNHSRPLFFKVFKCFPISNIGGKIILPQSAFSRLANWEIEFPWFFRIVNHATGKATHCGVLEFTAEEGRVYVPDFVMQRLNLQEGQSIMVKNAKLPRGGMMKLQPHTSDFMEILNPKEVLEKALVRDYPCLTVGDTISIKHQSKEFFIDVVDAQPSSSIDITETDCVLEFALPLDYKEPEKPVKKNDPKPQENKNGTKKFIPFTGRARRLDDKPVIPPSEDKSSSSNESIIAASKDKSPSSSEGFKPFTGKKYTLAG